MRPEYVGYLEVIDRQRGQLAQAAALLREILDRDYVIDAYPTVTFAMVDRIRVLLAELEAPGA